jgi:hypothetical protein
MNFTGGALSHLNPGLIFLTKDLLDPTGMGTKILNTSVLHLFTNH